MSDNICGAETRDGSPCQNYPVNGRKRCHLHGGRQARGTAHHNFKHGLYSKYASDSLKKILEELGDTSSEELIKPDEDIRLMQGLIVSSESLKKDLTDLDDLDQISRIIDRLVSAKQRSQKILIEQKRLVPTEDVEQFIQWLETLLISEFGSEKAFMVIDELKNFKLSDHETN